MRALRQKILCRFGESDIENKQEPETEQLMSGKGARFGSDRIVVLEDPAQQKEDVEHLREDNMLLQMNVDVFRKTADRLRVEGEQLRAEKEKLRAENERLRAEKEKLGVENEQSRTEREGLLEQYGRDRQSFDQLRDGTRKQGEDLDRLQVENEKLKESNARLQKEFDQLRNTMDTLQNTSLMLQNKSFVLKQEINRLGLLLQESLSLKPQLEREREGLQKCRDQLQEEREMLQKCRNRLNATMQTTREAVLLEAVSLLYNLGCLKMDSSGFDGITEELNITCTLRSVIFAKLLDASIKYPKDFDRLMGLPTLSEGLHWHSEDLCELQGLDATLSLKLARQVVRRMPPATTIQSLLCFRTCQHCQKSRLFHNDPNENFLLPTYDQKPGADRSAVEWMNEYPNFDFLDCCDRVFCTECLIQHFSAEFKDYELLCGRWAKDLSIRCLCGQSHDENWFHRAFRRSWSVYYKGVRNCMDKSWGRLMKTWTMMRSLRGALAKMSPPPSERAAYKGYILNLELSQYQKAFHYFDLELLDSLSYDLWGQDFHSWGWGKDAPWRTYGAGEVRYVELWSGTSSVLSVPLFLDFIKRESAPRTCSVCLEEIFEIDYGSPKDWEGIVSCSFPGPAMWKILKFPTTFEQECDHALEVCRDCTETHIATQLEENGCNAMSCPHCTRALTPREFKMLAKPETVIRFDELQLQTYLSGDPSFCWCLRPGCNSGQIHVGGNELPIMTCKSCQFKTCYRHKLPWKSHGNLTCDEFDSQREHGDPDHKATKEYLEGKTKTCPGPKCGILVAKGEGCFHMTCKKCHFEYCWECLADYSNIRKRGRLGHKPGCYFLINDVNPMSITGRNLESALNS